MSAETTPLLEGGGENGTFIENQSRDDTKPTDARSISSTEILNNANSEFARRLSRKIDYRLIPIMFITFNFNFIDKTILSSASVFGLLDDVSLVGNQFSWVSSMFYVGYFLWEYPTTILIQKLPIGKYVAGDILIWGVVVTATAACTNYGQLLAVRFFTGSVEATIAPAFLYITAQWYTRDQMPSRMSFWYGGNSMGGAVAGLASYGIGHIEHSLKPWKWLYIIFGVATALWGLIVLVLLPDSIASAKFLTEEEKNYQEQQVATAGTGVTMSTENKWKMEQVFECLRDPKTWFYFSISLLCMIPNGGTSSFSNLVLTGFGFSSIESTIANLPSSFFAFTTIILTGHFASKYRNITTFLISGSVIPGVVGSAVMNSNTSQVGKLIGYYFLGPPHAAIPLTMSLIGANVKGVTKKMTMTAIMFIAYCAGNMAGPQLFYESESPYYSTAFQTILICYTLAAVLSISLRYYLIWENRRRDKAEGTEAHSEPIRETFSDGEEVIVPDPVNTPVVALVVNTEEDDGDTTDWQTKGFRYRL